MFAFSSSFQYLYMYSCIHVYKHTCMDEHVQIYIYAYVCILMHASAHTHSQLDKCEHYNVLCLCASMCRFTSIHMYMHASVHALAFLQSPGTNVVQESNELHHTHKLQHNNPVVSIYIYMLHCHNHMQGMCIGDCVGLQVSENCDWCHMCFIISPNQGAWLDLGSD